MEILIKLVDYVQNISYTDLATATLLANNH